MCILTTALGLPEDVSHRSVLAFFLRVAVTSSQSVSLNWV